MVVSGEASIGVFFCVRCVQMSVQQRVFNIASELLHTEIAYVSKLHLLNQVDLFIGNAHKKPGLLVISN